ncbi:MAG: SMP-30/gluconolactonase/LRE family protein [Rhodospirillaceae bacterium]|nr:SMP-30/gluconolactonase/LRE family protein [Rhodospirillaceae bacterium]
MSFRAIALSLGLVLTATQAEAAYRARLLVPAGPFHGVHGLAFGPDGDLYAGDIMGSTVHLIDVATGKRRVAVGAPLGMADDVGFAPAGTPFAGTMVWTAVAVGKLYAQAPGGKPRVIAENLPSVNTVGFAPDGRLFVTQTGPANQTLWQVDLSGQTPPKKLWDQTGGLNGFVIAPDGFLYGPQADLGRVIKLDLNTMAVSVIAEGFQWPTAVEMDSKGLLYVGDFDAGTVTQLNKDTGEKVLIATIEPGIDNLAMGPAGTPWADKIYASSITRNGIFEIDPVSKAMRPVVAGQRAEGHLTVPGGVAMSSDGKTIYVADMFALRAVDAQSGQVRTLIPAGRASPYPSNVNITRMGERDVMVITSWFSGNVILADSTSRDATEIHSGFAMPTAAVMRADGTIVVAESGAKRLTVLGPNGSRATLDGVFEQPMGIAQDVDGKLYVSDAATGRLVEVDLTASTWRNIGVGLKRPEGVAMLPDGRVAVVDSGDGQVWAFDPTQTNTDAQKAAEIVSRLSVGLIPPAPMPETWVFNGIAAAPDGTVYLPSDIQAALYVLHPSGGPASFREALRGLTSWMFR